MTTPADSLERAIDGRAARVAVLGLGYAGLPVAEAFAHAGFAVLGHDTDASRVARLRAGESYLRTFPEGRVRDLLATGRFEANADHVRGPRDHIVPT